MALTKAYVWKAKKSRDKLIRHLVGPPYCYLAMKTRKNYISPDAFLPTLSRQEPLISQGQDWRVTSIIYIS